MRRYLYIGMMALLCAFIFFECIPLMVVILGSLGFGGDGGVEIQNDYKFFEPSERSNNKQILFMGGKFKDRPTILPRVDRYKVDGDKILVAQTPVEFSRDSNGSVVERLLGVCNHWVIDTKTHKVTMTDDPAEWGDLRCY